MIKQVPHPSSRDAKRLIDEWRAAIIDLRGVGHPRSGRQCRRTQLRGHLRRIRLCPDPAGDLPFGVPSWLGDDAVGRQSRPKRRNSVERDSEDILHTIIWRAPIT